MSRLIDADKMIEHLDLCLKDGDSSTTIVDATLTAIKYYVENAPTVDAVEVVRCRDCKYFEYDTWANFNGIPLIVAHEICQFNKSNPIKVHEEHYCSWGERKTE